MYIILYMYLFPYNHNRMLAILVRVKVQKYGQQNHATCRTTLQVEEKMLLILLRAHTFSLLRRVERASFVARSGNMSNISTSCMILLPIFPLYMYVATFMTIEQTVANIVTISWKPGFRSIETFFGRLCSFIWTWNFALRFRTCLRDLMKYG